MSKDYVARVKLMQRRLGVEDDGKIGTITLGAIERLLDVRDNVERPDTEPPGAYDDLDPRTAGNIATLDADARHLFATFARLAKATAASMGCDYVMISGNRSYAEQDALYRQQQDGKDNDRDGKTDEADERVTRAKAGYSNHNFGIAGDFGVFRGRAYLDNTDPAMAAKVHKAVSVHAEECGLEWGGTWNGFKDLPHFEVRTGLTLADKRKLMKEKGSVL